MKRKLDRYTAIDISIGQRIEDLRKASKVSRVAIANKLGVSFQQMSKYCDGSNRICIGRLLDVAKFLGKPLSYFVDEADPSLGNRMAIELCHNFVKLDLKQQVLVNTFVRGLANGNPIQTKEA